MGYLLCLFIGMHIPFSWIDQPIFRDSLRLKPMCRNTLTKWAVQAEIELCNYIKADLLPNKFG
jgi:hypothetical protein